MRILTRIECRSLKNTWSAVAVGPMFVAAPFKIGATCSQQIGQ